MSCLDKVDSKTAKAIERVKNYCNERSNCIDCPFETKLEELNGYFLYGCRLRDKPKFWDFEKEIRPISYDWLLAGVRHE